MKRWVTVKLLGVLGKKFFRQQEMFVSSAAEAVQLICLNFPSFATYVESSEALGQVYRVVSGEPLGRDEDELHLPCFETLTIAPLTQGSGAFGKILLGAALLGASFFMPATIGIFGATISSFAVGAFGASLILTGIAGILSPQNKAPKENEKKDSALFDRAADSGTQGKPVPLGYGRRIVTDLPILSQSITVTRVPV